MALVNIASVLADTRRLIKKTAPPGGVELLSYKRNRGIAIIKKDATHLELREHGYLDQELTIAESRLPKVLSTMIKREFPRSRKVRLKKFADPKELEKTYKKI